MERLKGSKQSERSKARLLDDDEVERLEALADEEDELELEQSARLGVARSDEARREQGEASRSETDSTGSGG